VRRATLAVLLAAACAPCGAAPRRAAPPAPAPVDASGLPVPGEIDASLIDAVNWIGEPNLVAVFAYMPMTSQPAAFAELLTRDHPGLKRYTAKLAKDMKVAGGLTAWDHEVCAVLINRFQVAADKSGLPDKKRMSQINQCMLSRVVPLTEVLVRRSS
jgi:hypothetical protein